jgi:hypothetical protein
MLSTAAPAREDYCIFLLSTTSSLELSSNQEFPSIFEVRCGFLHNWSEPDVTMKTVRIYLADNILNK